MKVEERNRMKDEDMKEMVPPLISVFLFFLLVGRTISLFYHTSVYFLPLYKCVESQRRALVSFDQEWRLPDSILGFDVHGAVHR